MTCGNYSTIRTWESSIEGILRRLDDIAEDRTPPCPGEVRDHVGRIGNEWSVVCVELARLVGRTA